jgi:hypothetical protein
LPRSIVFYISGHGFGHAVRQIEIIKALLRKAPSDLRVIVRTSAAAQLFGNAVGDRVSVQPTETDTGAVQIDALRLDERETVERARSFIRATSRRVADEAAVLRRSDAALVICDAPWLPCLAAHEVGIPSVVCANFTWDWIYAAYAGSAPDVDQVVAAISESYAAAGVAWRLPMHGGFESIREIVDVPFVARHGRLDRTREEVRRAFAVPLDRPAALVSFGGYRVNDLPLVSLDCFDGWTVVLTAHESSVSGLPSGVIGIAEERIYAAGLGYQDLVRAVDVVITKPGYGILAECMANGAAVLYTSRGNFREYHILVSEMPRYLRCRFLEMKDFQQGRWKTSLDALLAQPPAPEHPRTDGADVVARMILERIDGGT